jgi:hypothetical protein
MEPAPNWAPIVVAISTLIGVAISATATLIGVSITQRWQAEQQKLDREQRERADRLADARRLRDSKLERLRELYSTIIRTAQDARSDVMKIVVSDASEKAGLEPPNLPSAAAGLDDADVKETLKAANERYRFYRAGLALEVDAKEVGEKLQVLLDVMVAYVETVQTDSERDPVRTKEEFDLALDGLIKAAQGSLARVEASAS